MFFIFLMTFIMYHGTNCSSQDGSYSPPSITITNPSSPSSPNEDLLRPPQRPDYPNPSGNKLDDYGTFQSNSQKDTAEYPRTHKTFFKCLCAGGCLVGLVIGITELVHH